jgi:4-hydroxybenzoate polyprenyltransferase
MSLLFTIARISRAYSIPYTVLVGVCALLCGERPLIFLHYFFVCLLPIMLAIGLAALNDALHARRDQQAGRGRDYPSRFLLLLGVFGIVATFILAVLSGWQVVAGLGASVVLGLVYAQWKHIPLVGNILRGLTSVAITLGLGGIVGITPLTWILALATGLLDAAGNIWGDIRDVEVDARNDTRTIAVVSPMVARYAAVALHGIGVAIYSWLAPWSWISLFASIVAWFVRPAICHLVFLIGKYATFVVIGLHLAETFTEVAWLLGLGMSVIVVWPFYRAIHKG